MPDNANPRYDKIMQKIWRNVTNSFTLCGITLHGMRRELILSPAYREFADNAEPRVREKLRYAINILENVNPIPAKFVKKLTNTDFLRTAYFRRQRNQGHLREQSEGSRVHPLVYSRCFTPFSMTKEICVHLV